MSAKKSVSARAGPVRSWQQFHPALNIFNLKDIELNMIYLCARQSSIEDSPVELLTENILHHLFRYLSSKVSIYPCNTINIITIKVNLVGELSRLCMASKALSDLILSSYFSNGTFIKRISELLIDSNDNNVWHLRTEVINLIT